MTSEETERLIQSIQAWAQGRTDVISLAVVGSWARGTAQPDSDLDLMLLVRSPQAYRLDSAWPSAIAWQEAGFALAGYSDADYGKVWSRHLKLRPSADVEMSFGHRDWASLDASDPGSAQVVAEGCRVVLDRDATLRRFVDHVQGGN